MGNFSEQVWGDSPERSHRERFAESMKNWHPQFMPARPPSRAERELEKINQILRAHGFEYPLGARGVQDLADGYRVRQEELHRLDPEGWAAMEDPGDARPPGMRRTPSGPLSPVLPVVEHCCVCASAEVVYHNYQEQPFCRACADGTTRGEVAMGGDD